MVGMGVMKGVPRYYEEIFKCKDAISMEEIKEIRRKWREEHGEDENRLLAKFKVRKANMKLFNKEKI